MLPELERVPRVELAIAPTPLQEAPRLAAAIGLDRLLVKRDDNTGLALGGNKARKLEYLVADAQAQGADILITTGAAQSNHCRMTAAAARVAGMDAHLVFRDQPVDEVQGNMVLDRLLGATWSFAGKRNPAECMNEVAEDLRRAGKKPYVIPAGGSNGRGALGYVRCAFELVGQLKERGEEPRYVVCAGGSPDAVGFDARPGPGRQRVGLAAVSIALSTRQGRKGETGDDRVARDPGRRASGHQASDLGRLRRPGLRDAHGAHHACARGGCSHRRVDPRPRLFGESVRRADREIEADASNATTSSSSCTPGHPRPLRGSKLYWHAD
jgi:hypothetical protein